MFTVVILTSPKYNTLKRTYCQQKNLFAKNIAEIWVGNSMRIMQLEIDPARHSQGRQYH